MIDLINYLPIRNSVDELYQNNKGYSKEYIQLIVSSRKEVLIKAFSDSMAREEYMDKVKKLLQSKKLMFPAYGETPYKKARQRRAT